MDGFIRDGDGAGETYTTTLIIVLSHSHKFFGTSTVFEEPFERLGYCKILVFFSAHEIVHEHHDH